MIASNKNVTVITSIALNKTLIGFQIRPDYLVSKVLFGAKVELIWKPN